VRERIWRILLIVAILIGGLAVTFEAFQRIQEQREAQATPIPPDTVGSAIRLPMTVANTSPYPYPEPESQVYVDLQGGSTELIVGAALLVLIIVGGVIYGKDRLSN
jgi:hypothetical protein